MATCASCIGSYVGAGSEQQYGCENDGTPLHRPPQKTHQTSCEGDIYEEVTNATLGRNFMVNITHGIDIVQGLSYVAELSGLSNDETYRQHAGKYLFQEVRFSSNGQDIIHLSTEAIIALNNYDLGEAVSKPPQRYTGTTPAPLTSNYDSKEARQITDESYIAYCSTRHKVSGKLMGGTQICTLASPTATNLILGTLSEPSVLGSGATLLNLKFVLHVAQFNSREASLWVANPNYKSDMTKLVTFNLGRAAAKGSDAVFNNVNISGFAKKVAFFIENESAGDVDYSYVAASDVESIKIFFGSQSLTWFCNEGCAYAFPRIADVPILHFNTDVVYNNEVNGSRNEGFSFSTLNATSVHIKFVRAPAAGTQFSLNLVLWQQNAIVHSGGAVGPEFSI